MITSSLLFVDASSAKAWLATLPWANPGAVREALLDGLNRLASVEVSPLARAEITEVLRDKIFFVQDHVLQTTNIRRWPLAESEQKLFVQGQALWQAYLQQYTQLFPALMEKDPNLMPIAAKLLQRALTAQKEMWRYHVFFRQRLPSGFWQQLHQCYQVTETLELLTAAVSDPLYPDPGRYACYSWYSHILLLDLVDPYQWSWKQLNWVDQWLLTWARQYKMTERRPANATFLWEVDTQKDTGLCVAKPLTLAVASESVRFLATEKMALTIGSCLKKLKEGMPPKELGLGMECSGISAQKLLRDLEERWCRLPAFNPQVSPQEFRLCTHGLEAIYFRLTGMPFEKETPGVDYFTATNEFLAFSRIEGYDPRKVALENQYPWVSASARYSAGSLQIDERFNSAEESTVRKQWAWSHIVLVMEGSQLLKLGWVSRLEQTDSGRVLVNIRVWSGKPVPYRAEALEPMRTIKPFPLILLMEKKEEGEAPFAALPPGILGQQTTFKLVGQDRIINVKLESLMPPNPGADFQLVKVFTEGDLFQ